MYYLYGFTHAHHHATATVRGIADTMPVTVTYDRVAAVISPLPASYRTTPRLLASDESLWQHDRVVAHFLDHGDVLPARFGTILVNFAALDRVMGQHALTLLGNLGYVSNHVELAVRVLHTCDDDPVPVAPAPSTRITGYPRGRAYLEARLAEERAAYAQTMQASDAAYRIHDHLLPLARAGNIKVQPSPRTLMTGAYLVARDTIAPFKQQVATVAAAHRHWKVLCTGPWAPYSFVQHALL